jgi:hypothetical protein
LRCVNLTPDERREYSRIGIRTENWTRKVVNYMIEQPQFIPTFVDYTETNACEALKPLLRALEAARDVFDDTIMVLAELDGSELGYYSMMAGQNVKGAKAVYEDLAAQFPRNTREKRSTQTNRDHNTIHRSSGLVFLTSGTNHNFKGLCLFLFSIRPIR